MEEAKDLLPPDVVSRILKLLVKFRQSNGYGYIQIHIHQGRICGCGYYDGDRYPFKDNQKPEA